MTLSDGDHGHRTGGEWVGEVRDEVTTIIHAKELSRKEGVGPEWAQFATTTLSGSKSTERGCEKPRKHAWKWSRDWEGRWRRVGLARPGRGGERASRIKIAYIKTFLQENKSSPRGKTGVQHVRKKEQGAGICHRLSPDCNSAKRWKHTLGDREQRCIDPISEKNRQARHDSSTTQQLCPGAGGQGGENGGNNSVANGGNGLDVSITGTSVAYAGGGGSGTEVS